MSVLDDVLRELEAGADAAAVARRLGISPDLAATAIEHWGDAGRAAHPDPTTGLTPRADSAHPSAPCTGCEPRPRWRTALSCYGCPFAAPR